MKKTKLRIFYNKGRRNRTRRPYLNMCTCEYCLKNNAVMYYE